MLRVQEGPQSEGQHLMRLGSSKSSAFTVAHTRSTDAMAPDSKTVRERIELGGV